MKKFREYLKFVWQPKDIEHPKDRAARFVWQPTDLEHHRGPLKEEQVDEKINLSPDAPGNYQAPKNKPSFTPSSKTGYGKPYEDEAHEAFAAHHDSLSGDEEDAVRYYKSEGHSDINRYLRGAHKLFKKQRKEYFKSLKPDGLKFKDEPQSHKELKKQIKYGSHAQHHEFPEEPSEDDYHEHQMDNYVHHLDNVTNHRTTEHHVVFRGGIPGDATRFPVGHEFTDHGYMSTTFKHDTAHNFSSSHSLQYKGKNRDSYQAHVHVIHVPKGSRGHYLDVHGEDANHANSHEQEFLLNRGTRLKVMHHSTDGSTHYIHSRVIKQGIRPRYKMEKKQSHPEKPMDNHGLPGQQKFPFMKHHERFK